MDTKSVNQLFTQTSRAFSFTPGKSKVTAYTLQEIANWDEKFVEDVKSLYRRAIRIKAIPEYCTVVTGGLVVQNGLFTSVTLQVLFPDGVAVLAVGVSKCTAEDTMSLAIGARTGYMRALKSLRPVTKKFLTTGTTICSSSLES